MLRVNGPPEIRAAASVWRPVNHPGTKRIIPAPCRRKLPQVENPGGVDGDRIAVRCLDLLHHKGVVGFGGVLVVMGGRCNWPTSAAAG